MMFPALLITILYGLFILAFMAYSKYQQHHLISLSDLTNGQRTSISVYSLITALYFIVASAKSFYSTIFFSALILSLSKIKFFNNNLIQTTPLKVQLRYLILGASSSWLYLNINKALVRFLCSYVFLQSSFFYRIIALLFVVALNVISAKGSFSNPLDAGMMITAATALLIPISAWVDISSTSAIERAITEFTQYHQSTHSSSVHASASNSATKLKRSITNTAHSLLSVINDYYQYVNSNPRLSSEEKDKAFKQIAHAKSIMDKLDLNYKDKTSSVTNAELTSLLANAIMDPRHRVDGVDVTTCQERIVSALCEMEEGNEMICSPGQFNKLIESQQNTLKDITLVTINNTVINDFILHNLRKLMALPATERPNPTQAEKLLRDRALNHFTYGTELSGPVIQSTRDYIKTIMDNMDITDYIPQRT